MSINKIATNVLVFTKYKILPPKDLEPLTVLMAGWQPGSGSIPTLNFESNSTIADTPNLFQLLDRYLLYLFQYLITTIIRY